MLVNHVWHIANQLRRPVEEVNYKYVKQTGGHGQYGHVVISLEPGERGSGVVFENKVVGGAIPREYIPAVEKGIKEVSESGVMAGYPVVDIKVTLFDGSFHEVDSNEMAFKMAATFAFKEGVQKGGPVLLEPIMKVEAVAPEEFLGRYYRRVECPPGNYPRYGNAPGKCPGDQCNRAAGRNVRVCDRIALDNPGTGCFFDGI